MMRCDCSERVGIKIDSIKLFEELKIFFEERVEQGVFKEIKVKEPYYVWKNGWFKRVKWYADKWYKCKACGVLWEFKYPDFPAQGFVKKYVDGIYTGKEVVKSGFYQQ